MHELLHGGAQALVSLLAFATFALLAAWAWVSLAARALRLPEFFDEVHSVETDDGATIIVARIRPRGARAAEPPVLLCHGLAMNRRAFALERERCFALALAERGRDVWVLELRGAAEGRARRAMRRATFDHYARHDVPRAIEFVLRSADARELDWVGFSIGGMLGYAHLGALGGGGVRRLVTIGSPVHFEDHPASRGVAVLPMLFAPALWLTRTPFRALSLLAAPLMWTGLPRSLSQGLRAEHYTSESLRRVMANALADVPTGVSRQFVRWLQHGTFDSEDRAVDYRGGLAKITVPTLIVVGSHDRLATPYAAVDAQQRLGAALVEVQIVGTQTGATRDYDHLDLILGRSAIDEVFPSVARWIERDRATLSP
jgi:pimeloyl-ACP methyl ester carboxylesterase